MKKKVISIALSLAMIAGLGSGMNWTLRRAQAEAATPDVKVSVSTDKSVVKPGDEVTVTVAVDSFASTLAGDKDASVNVVPDEPDVSGIPRITTFGLEIPIDTDIFEFVSKKAGTIKSSAVSYDKSTKSVKAAATNAYDDENNIVTETDTSVTLFSFVLKVKDDVDENKTVSIALNDSGLVLKNVYLTTNELYSVQTTSADIEVKGKEVSSISLKSAPSKTSYFVDDTLDVTGGVISVAYSNGSTEDVTLTKDMCTGADFSTAGKKTITVTYDGKTTSFDVNVSEKKAVSFTLNNVDGKSIIEGQTLSTDGMTATVTYNDGSTSNVNLTADMLAYDNTKTGTQTVTVTIGSITNTFSITVNAKTLTELVLTSQPSKTVYLQNQTFDKTGLEVTAKYDNGTAADVTGKVTLSAADMTKAETQKITVTYKENSVEKTVDFNIDVKSVANVTALNNSISALSAKTLTAADETSVKALRTAYNAMSDLEKAEIKEADITALEKKMSAILEAAKPTTNTNPTVAETPTESTNPTVTETPTETANPIAATEPSNTKTETPATGDSAPVAALFVLMALSAAGAVTVKKIKKA